MEKYFFVFKDGYTIETENDLTSFTSYKIIVNSWLSHYFKIKYKCPAQNH